MKTTRLMLALLSPFELAIKRLIIDGLANIIDLLQGYTDYVDLWTLASLVVSGLAGLLGWLFLSPLPILTIQWKLFLLACGWIAIAFFYLDEGGAAGKNHGRYVFDHYVAPQVIFGLLVGMFIP